MINGKCFYKKYSCQEFTQPFWPCRDSSEGNFGATPEPEPSLGEKKSRVESLKEWGMRLLRTSEPVVRLRREATRRKWDKEEPTPHSSSGNWSASSDNGSTATSHHPRYTTTLTNNNKFLFYITSLQNTLAALSLLISYLR